jgi:hypothetical protein
MEWIDGWSVFLLDTIELRAELYDLCRGKQGSCEPVKFALPSGTGVWTSQHQKICDLHLSRYPDCMHLVHILLYNIYWISIYMVI